MDERTPSLRHLMARLSIVPMPETRTGSALWAGFSPRFQGRKPPLMTATDSSEPTRRDFIFIATGAMAAVGGVAAIWPFISQMNPDASVRALSTVDVDLTPLAEGQGITVKWRGNPVFIRY